MEARHTRLTTEFITTRLGPIIKTGPKSVGEVMVITESLQFGILLVLREIYSMTPSDAVQMMEICLDQTIKRFAKESNKKEGRE